jgi:hypothetical protein
LAGGIALAAAALLVACTALVGNPSSLSGRSDVLRPDELAEIENRAKFCGVYDDPVQCLKDHIASQHRYWTSREVREELFKTMKGLAELEVRDTFSPPAPPACRPCTPACARQFARCRRMLHHII